MDKGYIVRRGFFVEPYLFFLATVVSPCSQIPEENKNQETRLLLSGIIEYGPM